MRAEKHARPIADAIPVEFDVTPFRDLHGRWHRNIRLRTGSQMAPPSICARCHVERAGVACIGFDDWDSAAENGWQAVRELLKGRALKQSVSEQA
jgi:hypothetical protein